MMFETQKGDYFKVSDLTREQYDDLRLLYNQKITDSATVHLCGNIWNMQGWSYVGWDKSDEWDCWSDPDVYGGRLLTYEQVFPNVAVEDAEPTLQQKSISEQLAEIEKRLTTGSQTTRTSVLQNAIDIINGDRQEDYGDPSRNFKNVANGWSIIFGKKVEPYEVALAMDWLKTCRLLKDGDHADSWIDKAGYTGLGAELALLKDSE